MKIKKFLLLLIIAVCFISPYQIRAKAIQNATQRKVLMEMFTATWCGPCAAYGHYADETYDYFGSNKVVLVRNQVWKDGLDTPETNAKCSFYGVDGVPSLYVSGQYKYHPMNYSDYRTKINEILSKSAQVSIVLDAQTSSGSQFINLNIEVKLIENINTENLNLVAVLYEKKVNYTGSNKIPTHRFVIRDYIFDEIGSRINFINGTAKINLPILLKKGSNPEDFGVAAWVQDMKTLEVLQAESSDIKVVSGVLPPVILLPKLKSFIKDLPILAKWIGDGDSYQIEISDKEDFSNIILSKETQKTEEQIDNLNKRTTFFLRVKTKKGSSESAFSTAVSFTITNKQGAQFKNLNNGDLCGGTPNTFIQDPVNLNVLYVGSYGGGIFKSIDSGKTWSQKNFGLDDLYVTYLDIDLDKPDRVFAGTDSGVFMTENGGDVWIYIGGASSQKVQYIQKTKELFALGTYEFYKTSDDGKTWNSTLLPKNLQDYFLHGFAIDKKSPSKIFLAGYSYGDRTSFLYKTQDGGNNWTKINLDLAQGYNVYSDVAIDCENSNIVYFTVLQDFFKSEDGGNTFSKLKTLPHQISQLSVDRRTSGRVACTTSAGFIYISNDFGANWVELSPATGGADKLFFDVQDKNKLYICSWKSGFYISSDSGKNFIPNNSGFFAIEVSKIVRTPDIVAMTLSGTFSLANNIWQKDNTYSFSETDKIKQNPQNPSEIIVLSPIYWSQDGGKTWEYHKLGNWLYSYTFDVSFKDKTIFFIYQNNSKWYLGKSDFYGNVTESYEIASQKISWIYRILVDQENPNNIYLAVSVNYNSTTRKYEGSGLLKSTDGGKTFQEYAFKEDSVTKIFIDTNNQDTLFANTWSGLYKSIDKGAHWKQVSPSEASALGFASDNKTIYAAFGKSLAVSTDYGDSWTYIPWDYSINFSRPKINDILVDQDNPNIVYISTDGSGVYMYFIPNTQNFSIVSSAGVNGTISPSGTVSVNYGDSQTFNITPNTGYKISDVKVDGTSVGAVSTYTFTNVTSNHTIEVTFEPITYTITASAVTGGSISPSGTTTVNSGDSKTFTITPYSGYKISNVKVDGASKGLLSFYTFTNIISNHTIEAVFEEEKKETVIILQIGNSTFTVNGVPKTLDSPPVIKNNRTLLPIRAIIEALGGTVGWDANDKKVTVSLDLTTIELWIGKSIAKVNGVDTPIDSTNPKVVPEIINSRTMLPLRFVTENLGCDVQWDGTTKTITITYQGG